MHNAALNQRIGDLKEEADNLRYSLEKTEAAHLQLLKEHEEIAHSPQLCAVGIQASLPSHFAAEREQDRNHFGLQILQISVCTQTDTLKSAKCEVTGTQTDLESLKEERLSVWQVMPQHVQFSLVSGGCCLGKMSRSCCRFCTLMSIADSRTLASS